MASFDTLLAQAAPLAGHGVPPRLARYKIPRVFELRDTLPRTATGKLLKHTLRTAAPTSP